MKAKWLQMAQNAKFVADNNLCGLSDTDDISAKYYAQIAMQAAKYYEIAAYCLKRAASK